MSLIITPIPAFTDNYIWAMVNDTNKQAIVIDPGQAEPVADYLQQYGLELTAIWITHHHHDHIGGVAELRELYPMTHVVASSDHGVSPDQVVKEGSSVSAWGYTAQVWAVPGHTESHLAYVLAKDEIKQVFCGDTLFSAGCGRVFTGTIEQLFESFKRFNKLPKSTLFYPAHEYTASNLKFGLSIEPDNTVMQQCLTEVIALTEQGKSSLPVSLEHERQVNVFLRTEELTVIDGVQRQVSLPDTKSLTVFSALRTLKDNF
ncbi:hydroxyacylglutathione hydrolase [Psychrobacter sanguinis]|uniref:hydroxyacylglutathione hydrolase n=1 Tax=Psychrobacter sanguinis TaxID=861445 RepID=UPI00020C60A6|nr:hydroxyacylglutathione hydrolase [Psychrobacter sanguinis]EGK15233.1 hydroxyacylglutathione hydrolase [Psychrobacter sp. 1501(2011)]MCD9151336.1 hydroxyacylglutathione hydrolase [Psychrobacter sanguinis]MDY3307571.1 hydroxyacylglutathione hydrolase [Psychrobacter sanguinis]HBH33385.1 hydroxyacylglutathione hydrolase [Psychrobacter sp.]